MLAEVRAAMELSLKELHEANCRLTAMCIHAAALKRENVRRHGIMLLAAM